MKVKELKKILDQYDDELNVDCDDGNGIYTNINDVQLQKWTDSEGKRYMSLAIMHYGYNKENALIG